MSEHNERMMDFLSEKMPQMVAAFAMVDKLGFPTDKENVAISISHPEHLKSIEKITIVSKKGTETLQVSCHREPRSEGSQLKYEIVLVEDMPKEEKEERAEKEPKEKPAELDESIPDPKPQG